MNELPKHISLTIEHNPHKTFYESVDQHLLKYPPDTLEFADDADRQRCVEADELWVMTWYPHTPVGFCCIAASTFEGLMAIVRADGQKNGCPAP